MKLSITALQNDKINLSGIFYQAMMKMIQGLDLELEEYEVVYLEEPLITDFYWEIKFSHRNFEYKVALKEDFDVARNEPYSGMIYKSIFECDVPEEDNKTHNVVVFMMDNMS